jgi:hypothetical protein
MFVEHAKIKAALLLLGSPILTAHLLKAAPPVFDQ